jgi:two-component system response regulator PilR (NtrC family)
MMMMMMMITAPSKALEIQAEFDARTRDLGLTELAIELGHTPKSQLESTLDKILTVDHKMLEIKNKIRKLSPTNLSILILGETGTGKEFIAEALHGNRKMKSFIPVNCGAIPADLLESELFGSKKGSFTGANFDRIGLIERSRDGTLFLDEIGDMPPLLQCKLLRVIQEKKYREVGGSSEIPVNFRLVSATNHLDLLTKENFRKDLYYRLAGSIITLPTLKERNPEDIKLICYHYGKTPEIAEQVRVIADNLALDGNIRELINLIEETNALD